MSSASNSLGATSDELLLLSQEGHVTRVPRHDISHVVLNSDGALRFLRETSGNKGAGASDRIGRGGSDREYAVMEILPGAFHHEELDAFLAALRKLGMHLDTAAQSETEAGQPPWRHARRLSGVAAASEDSYDGQGDEARSLDEDEMLRNDPLSPWYDATAQGLDMEQGRTQDSEAHGTEGERGSADAGGSMLVQMGDASANGGADVVKHGAQRAEASSAGAASSQTSDAGTTAMASKAANDSRTTDVPPLPAPEALGNVAENADVDAVRLPPFMRTPSHNERAPTRRRKNPQQASAAAHTPQDAARENSIHGDHVDFDEAMWQRQRKATRDAIRRATQGHECVVTLSSVDAVVCMTDDRVVAAWGPSHPHDAACEHATHGVHTKTLLLSYVTGASSMPGQGLVIRGRPPPSTAAHTRLDSEHVAQVLCVDEGVFAPEDAGLFAASVAAAAGVAHSHNEERSDAASMQEQEHAEAIAQASGEQATLLQQGIHASSTTSAAGGADTPQVRALAEEARVVDDNGPGHDADTGSGADSSSYHQGRSTGLPGTSSAALTTEMSQIEAEEYLAGSAGIGGKTRAFVGGADAALLLTEALDLVYVTRADAGYDAHQVRVHACMHYMCACLVDVI